MRRRVESNDGHGVLDAPLEAGHDSHEAGRPFCSSYSDSGAVAVSSQALVASSTCGRTSWRTLS